MPRTFIAFPLDKTVQDRLYRMSTELDCSGADIKWVAAGHLHITLRFLGNIDDTMVEQISEKLPALFKEIQTIPISISRLGAFPSLTHPKVIWAGLTEQHSTINAVYDTLQATLLDLGLAKEERAFSAHITLGRVRRRQKNNALKNTLSSCRFEPPLQQSLSKVVFYQSTLTPQGPLYTVLKEAPLKDSFTPQV